MRGQIHDILYEFYSAQAEIKSIRSRQIPRMKNEIREMKESGASREEIREVLQSMWEARQMIGELVSIKVDARERIQALKNGCKQTGIRILCF